MDFLTIFSSIILVVLLYYYFKRENYFHKHGIDYVKPFPLVGNMAAVLLQRISVPDFIQRIYDSHKDAKYVGFFEFSRPTIMIRDLEIIKDITTKYFSHFVNHQGFTDPIEEPLFGTNLFSLNNDKWREMRALLTPSFTLSKLKGMFILISKCADNFTNYYVEKFENEPFGVNSKDAFSRYTNDIIATCAYGMEIDSLKDLNNEFYVLARKVATLDGIIGFRMFFIRNFPRISKLFKIKLFPAYTEKFFTELVRDTIARRDEQGISRPDMLQLMMDTRNTDDKNLRALTIQEMTAQAFAFFFGGFDTPSSLMCYIAHFLASHEDIQIKLQNEVDEVFEKCNGDLSYEAVNSMVYLDAVVNETLRMFPINSFLDRVCTAPFELPPATPGRKPVVLKPGDCVWIPIFPLQRDPRHYENPDVFDPERFIKNGKISVDPALPLMAFGLGPRSCIGNKFSLMEMKVLFVHLLRKVWIKPSARMITPLQFSSSSFTMIAKGGFWLEFERRKK